MDVDKEEVCVSCSNGFQTINFDHLEFNFEQPAFGIPNKIFASQNVAYSLKTLDISNITVKKLKDILCSTFDSESGILKLISSEKGEFDLEINIVSNSN